MQNKKIQTAVLSLVIGLLIFVAFLSGMAFQNHITRDKIEKELASIGQRFDVTKTTTENGAIKQTFETKNVKIDYFENKDKSYYDLIITPKNGTNLSSEWEIESLGNYKELYLVGDNEKASREFHEKNFPSIPFTWNQ